MDGDAQAELAELTAAVEQFGVVGTYAAAEAAGLRPGVPRAPLRPLDDDSGVQIRTMVRRC